MPDSFKSNTAGWKRVTEFVTDQARKTWQRPRRIVEVPYNLLWPWIRRLSPTWFHFEKGSALLQRDQPLEAWAKFSRCLNRSNDPHHFFESGVCLSSGLGRSRDAVGVWARANELRRKKATELKLSASPTRFLGPLWAAAIGHLATIDYVVKLGILEGQDPADTLFFAPPAATANLCYAGLWRRHLAMVESEDKLPLPIKALETLSFDFKGPRQNNGSTLFFWELGAKTYRRWREEQRGPLLALPDDIERRGWDALAGAGIPSDAWFVALHVREAGFREHHARLHDVLNARIADYLPAIGEITSRGGWVIRMGDPSMAPLPTMPNVLDYCHCGLRSDWMDVFLWARCRFFIGTASGPAYVPPTFGVPCVLTNWWAQEWRPWHAGDIFIPKIVRDLTSLRRLTLAETLQEPFRSCHSRTYLKDHWNVAVEDSDPEDIRAAVVEMLDRLDGTGEYDKDDAVLRDRADQIYENHSAFGMASLARDFLRRHKFYLNN